MDLLPLPFSEVREHLANECASCASALKFAHVRPDSQHNSGLYFGISDSRAAARCAAFETAEIRKTDFIRHAIKVQFDLVIATEFTSLLNESIAELLYRTGFVGEMRRVTTITLPKILLKITEPIRIRHQIVINEGYDLSF